jgi:hypothetical protein
MSGPRPSVTVDGGDVTVTSKVQAYLIEYQCVTSHGNEAVSDATTKTNVGHSSGMTILTSFKYDQNDNNTKKGLVHVPIHNPPSMTKHAYLQSIYVKFKGFNDATVESVILYYDSNVMVATNTRKSDTFHIDFSTNEASFYQYVVPTGISVTLDLRFPNENSSINLYSITLVYKAT